MQTLTRYSESQRRNQLISPRGIKMNDKKLYSIIKDRFDYRDGELFYKYDVGKRMKAGEKAGHYTTNKYSYITIDQKRYLIHRLIYLWHHKYLPDTLDHINNERQDNRIENLRPATVSQNAQNRCISVRNTTGVKGVYFHKRSGQYVARIRSQQKNVFYKYCETIEEAEKCLQVARENIHGKYANHG